MTVTINGSGTITGLSAGGLPDGSITTDELAANAVTLAKMARSGTAGQVLTSSGAGADPTYADLPAGGVTSITGTASQITASASTGAVTLSLPSTINVNAATATLATKASTLSQSGGSGAAMTFNWSGQTGQPTWLWGSNDGTNIYVWNPSNFSVSTATKLSTASGSAPSYSARAWVSFNGISGISYYGSGNISSVTRYATGGYYVTMSTAMPDSGYGYNVSIGSPSIANIYINLNTGGAVVSPTTSVFYLQTNQPGSGLRDQQFVNVAVYR